MFHVSQGQDLSAPEKIGQPPPGWVACQVWEAQAWEPGKGKPCQGARCQAMPWWKHDVNTLGLPSYCNCWFLAIYVRLIHVNIFNIGCTFGNDYLGMLLVWWACFLPTVSWKTYENMINMPIMAYQSDKTAHGDRCWNKVPATSSTQRRRLQTKPVGTPRGS